MKNNLLIKAAAAATVIALILCGCLSESGSSHGYAPPEIITQPSDVTTRPGEWVTFETAAEGRGLLYQWYYKKRNASRWSVWNGHDTSSTKAQANASWGGMRVYCRITGPNGCSAATRAATVSLGKTVEIISQPEDVTVNLGQTAFFRVEAAGEGLRYQWYFCKTGSRLWTKWKGHTGSETQAQANDTWVDMHVCCLVSDRQGNSVCSGAAAVTVLNRPTVISHPQSIPDSAAGQLRFSVKGGTEGLGYQWFFKPEGAAWGMKIMDKTDSELSLVSQNLWNGSRIYCRIKNPGGRMIYSDAVKVYTDGRPVILSSPVCAAAKAGSLMAFSVRAEGSGLRYRWQLRLKDSPAWISLSGRDGPDLTLSAWPLFSGAMIRCAVTDSRGRKVYSDAAGISVTSGADISSQPEDVTVSSGEAVRIRTATGASGAKFQWYIQKTGYLRPVMLRDQTSDTFDGIADSSWHNALLICKVTADDGSHVFSRAARVTVNDILTLKASPEDITARSGERPFIGVMASGRDLKYQWLRRDFGSDKWVKWEGQNLPAVSSPASTSWHKMKVRCDITDCTGRLISSDSASVWITDALDILRQPQSISVAPWQPVEFSVAAQGKGLRYQWYYRKADMTEWHIWRKHTSSDTYAVSNPTWDGMKVICEVSDSEGNTLRSEPAVVRINHS